MRNNPEIIILPAALLRAFLIVPVLASLLSCAKDDPVVEKLVIPVVFSLSNTELSPGDTLTIVGEKFATPASNNRVVFNNELATPRPFYATAESILVEIPTNATTGPMYVTSLGVRSNETVLEIVHGVGDVWVVGEGSFGYKAKVTGGNAEFLLIPHSASGTSGTLPYTITTGDAQTYPSGPQVSSRGVGTVTRQLQFEAETREAAYEYIERYGRGRKLDLPKQLRTTEAPAVTEDFLVYQGNTFGDFSANPMNFVTVTAALQYDGRRALVYADNANPAGGFTPAQYEAFGVQFDDMIFPTDSMFFGEPTDIDGDNKVVILFTGAVNEITPDGKAQTEGFVSGFFLLNDLLPGVFKAGTSNAREIFYVMVPDPGGVLGNPFSQTLVSDVIPGTLAHEFEHMVSDGYRVLIFGGGTNIAFRQDLWLEEGMAHMAEDLNGFDRQNLLRGALYLDDPGAVPMISGGDTLERRGGTFLLLRYLGDRYGDHIYRQILQSTCRGTTCIDNVTGRGFFAGFADFLAALYLDDRGITSDPRYEFTSLNIQNDFLNLVPPRRLLVLVRTAGDVINDNLKGTSGDFFLLSGAQQPALDIQMSAADNHKIRIVIVRTQ